MMNGVGNDLRSLTVLLGTLLVWPGLASPAHAARADFNGDGFEDLAIGIVGAPNFIGEVAVIYGSPAGLTASNNQRVRQNAAGGALEDGDLCGAALATGDFDDDGFADLAVGCPGEDVNGTADAGAVFVLYGGPAGLSATGSQLFHGGNVGFTPGVDSQCGASLAAGDFNADGYADLAWGCPGHQVSGFTLGLVYVLYGGPTGLNASAQRLFCPGFNVFQPSRCGAALAAADFNGDGRADLAAGAPGLSNAAGGVTIFSGSAGGLSQPDGQMTFSQDTPGVGDQAEGQDRCGSALAAGDFDGDGFADLAWGCPGEGVGTAFVAGAVNVLYGSPLGLSGTGSQFFSQNTVGVAGVAETADRCGLALAAGDFDGDGFADLAIGCPDEDLGAANAGSVNILYGSGGGLTATGNHLLSQNTSGIDGTAETGDNFGAALTVGDFNGDGFADLVVGVPREDIGNIVDAGGVNVIYGSTIGLTAIDNQFLSEDTTGILGAAGTGNLFGVSLSGS